MQIECVVNRKAVYVILAKQIHADLAGRARTEPDRSFPRRICIKRDTGRHENVANFDYF